MMNTSRFADRPTTTAYIPYIHNTQPSDSRRSDRSYPPPDPGGRWSTSGESDPLAEPIETSSSSVNPDVSLILPTYNERGTIRDVLETARAELETSGYTVEVLVVDDDSPDGTGQFVEQTYADDGVKAIIRRDDAGLSSAVLDGLRRSTGRYAVVMDADGQHPPWRTSNLITQLTHGADIAVGSRHILYGGVQSLSLTRRAVSAVASSTARSLVPSARSTSDPMSGFFAVDRETVDDDVLAECDPHGYKILVELLSKAGNVEVADVPISFRERQGGESKLTLDEIVRFVEHAAGLGLEERGIGVAVPQLVRSLEFGFTTALALFVLMLGLITGDVDGAGGAALIGTAGGLLTLSLLRFLRTSESWTDTEERYAKS